MVALNTHTAKICSFARYIQTKRLNLSLNTLPLSKIFYDEWLKLKTQLSGVRSLEYPATELDVNPRNEDRCRYHDLKVKLKIEPVTEKF